MNSTFFFCTIFSAWAFQWKHLAAIGLLLDIVGAFFLAVEAIKIHNLRQLRQRWLEPTGDDLLNERKTPLAKVIRAALYVPALILTVICLGVIYENDIGKIRESLDSKGYIVLALLLLAVLTWGTAMVFKAIARLVLWIEETVGTGAVGIIGFAILSIGFLLQLLATLQN